MHSSLSPVERFTGDLLPMMMMTLAKAASRFDYNKVVSGLNGTVNRAIFGEEPTN